MKIDGSGNLQEVTPGSGNPEVFMSYSYDGASHKAWVARLAGDLRKKGINAVLDQWELRPGCDLYLFMSNSIPKADHVCVVCTPAYKRKGQAGKGGVGYEGAVINAELIQDQDTDKFIPVLASGSAEESIPDWLRTKVHVDFREERQYEERLDELLRAIHSAPRVSKPPVGPSPFSGQTSEDAGTGGESSGVAGDVNVGPDHRALLSEIPEAPLGPSEAYELARKLIRLDDVIGWQDLVKQGRRGLPERLLAWRQNAEASQPQNQEELLRMVNEAMAQAMPMISTAVAGVESARPGYCDQRALLDDLINVPGWRRSGLTVLVEMPKAIGFVYAYLYGAACLSTRQIEAALDLAEMNLVLPGYEKSQPLWKNHEIIGWPTSFGGDCRKALEYMLGLPGSQGWLDDVFVRPEECSACMYGFNILLSAVEMTAFLGTDEGAEVLRSGPRLHYDVPVMFVLAGRDHVRRGFHLAFHDRTAIDKLSKEFNVPISSIRESWPLWVKRAEHVMFASGWPSRGQVPTELP